MRFVLAGIVLVHGLIHLMGFAKAFGLGELPQLTRPIARPVGLLWLACSLALLAASGLIVWAPHAWPWVGLPALILSQALIVTSWRDAKLGTIANLIILAPLIGALLDASPSSYRSQYRAAVREKLVSRVQPAVLVADADLAPLPAPVQRYLRLVGVVGKPRVQSFRTVYTGRFRNGPDSRWMPFRSEQYDFYDDPTRVFLMTASFFGVPMQAFHLYRSARASMRVKMASLVEVVNARGPKVDQGETVTFFNDLCVMAPACLIDRQRIRWLDAGPQEALAQFANGGITIGARLTFNEAGQLVDFVSNDRFMSADGRTFESYPWSTPVTTYEEHDGYVLPASAELVWRMPGGDFTYGRFHLEEVEYNPSVPRD